MIGQGFPEFGRFIGFDFGFGGGLNLLEHDSSQ